MASISSDIFKILLPHSRSCNRNCIFMGIFLIDFQIIFSISVDLHNIIDFSLYHLSNIRGFSHVFRRFKVDKFRMNLSASIIFHLTSKYLNVASGILFKSFKINFRKSWAGTKADTCDADPVAEVRDVCHCIISKYFHFVQYPVLYKACYFPMLHHMIRDSAFL